MSIMTGSGDFAPPRAASREHADLMAAFFDLGRVREAILATPRIVTYLGLSAPDLLEDYRALVSCQADRTGPETLAALDAFMGRLADRMDAAQTAG